MPIVNLADWPDRAMFVDPAGDRQVLKRARARSAIVVVAADGLSRYFVLAAWAERATTDRLIDQLFALAATWQPHIIGIEANAMQTLFAATIVREARQKALRLPIRAVHQPTGLDKDFRIRAALQPVVREGRLFIPETFLELRTELGTFPTNIVKDLVDALASCVELLPRRPTRGLVDETADDLAAYLRKSGAPPWYIEQRVAAVKRGEAHKPMNLDKVDALA